YTPEDIEKTLPKLYDSRVDMVTLADSYGGLLPNDVEHLVKLFKKGTGKMVGFHAHNNLQLAFANTIRAVEAGAGIVDASIYGMGRGAGNLPLEVLLSYIRHHENEYVNMVHLLEIIEQEFIDLKKKIGWGYNLHYMLSGMLGCHPYYASHLLEKHKLNMKDVWAKLIRIGKDRPMTFDKKLLEEVVAESTLENTKIEQIDFSRLAPETVKLEPPAYMKAHEGRDFLVLAQGPSLKKNITKIKEFAKEHNLVILGANYLHGLIVPDYHAFSSMSRFLQYHNFVDPNSKLLLGKYISEKIAKKYIKREFETIPYIDSSELSFDITDGIIQTNCATVSILLVGVAIVMGARRIYVAGLDGYQNVDDKETHFYKETVKVPKGQELNSLHNICQQYLTEIREYQIKNGQEPFQIITPTSYQEFYKKQDGF
ncbi:hypothetical protein A2335_00765, partial [Candidatus Peregrinibacteria bacterium RIFOXYB2_FULL_32_7]